MANGHETASGADFPDLARQLFGNVRLQFGDGPAHARHLSSDRLGVCRLSALEAGAHTVRGERVVKASHDPDALKLLIQERGESVIEQGGRAVDFGGGAPVLYDPTHPYTLVNRTGVRLMMLQVPRNAFSPRAVQSLVAPRLASASLTGLWHVLRSTMQTSLAEAAGLDEASRNSLGDSLLNLVRPLVEGEPVAPEAGRPGSLDMLLERAKAYVMTNLDRPDLSLGRIAARMGCSPRYLFRAFESEQTTPSQYIWDLRLERARAELAAPDSAMRTISDIAFSFGFSSSAHFSRAFRNRYGIAPRDWRRAALSAVRP